MSDGDTKDAKLPAPLRRAYTALTTDERLEALALADEMLLRHVVDRRVEAALVERYGLSAEGAREVVAEARGVALAESVPAALSKSLHLRSLRRLYERAWQEGKLAVCVSVAREIREIEGHGSPHHMVLEAGSSTDRQAQASEIALRSDEDLGYFAVHGHWPEGSGGGGSSH